MMNIKKYRAETTREALEQIKSDLGEDAFVLETKQVQTGGFLGFRTKKQIEISATPSLESAENGAKHAGNKKSALKKSNFFNLTDDSPALPTKHDGGHEPGGMMEALNFRAASVGQFENAFPFVAGKSRNRLTAPVKDIEAVELSPEAPKLIHARKETEEYSIPDAELPIISASTTTAKPAESASRTELALLRAELREVKFSINSFVGGLNTQGWKNAGDVVLFSEVFDPQFSTSFIEMTRLGFSPEFAHDVLADVIPRFKDGLIELSDITRAAVESTLKNFINFGTDPFEQDEPGIMAVIGATGVGKTTTVAKLAARIALRQGRSVELVTLDTYRIAAVDQLKTYAEIIGAGCHVVSTVQELEATINSLPKESSILIDTTGRNPLDLADQYEISDFLASRKDIRKCLAVQATTHPTDAAASIKKFGMYGADCMALTKLDETTRPGAMLELISESSLPLTYLCIGQRVPEDIKVATSESLADIIHNRGVIV